MAEENIIIGDYLFTGAELSIDNSRPYNELVTTKIMGGTSRHRLGEWTPIEFTVTVPYIFEDIEEIEEIMTNLHGTFQEVLCPYVTEELINTYVKVNKDLASPNVYNLEFEIEQVGTTEEYTPVSDVNGFILEETVEDTEE